MRSPSSAVVTRAVSIVLAFAAVALLAFTALANYNAGHRRQRAAAAPSATTPVTPVPASTVPGTVDVPTTPPATTLTPAQKRAWLKRLAGKWAQDRSDSYFQFRPNGAGEWVAFGQRLWTGTATPRGGGVFDLSDQSGHGASYWRVMLVAGDKKLRFAGTQQTYHRI